MTHIEAITAILATCEEELKILHGAIRILADDWWKQRAVNVALLKLTDAEFGLGLKLDALHELQIALREALK